MRMIETPAQAAEGTGPGNDPTRRETRGFRAWLRILAWPLAALGALGAQNGISDADKKIEEEIRHKKGGVDEAKRRIVEEKKKDPAARENDTVAHLREPASVGFPSMPRCSDFKTAIAAQEACEANFDPKLHAKLIQELGPIEKVLAIKVEF